MSGARPESLYAQHAGSRMTHAHADRQSPENTPVHTHLVSLHLGDQVFKRRETAQPHDRLGLLNSQAVDFGSRAGAQDNLIPPQEVLELGVIGGLPVKAQSVSPGH